MRWSRLAPTWLLLTTLTAVPGCRTAGVGDITRRDSLPNPVGRSAADVLAQHNQNAERVRSVEARPWIKVTSSRSLRAGLNGRLAMERPRNFKLSITGGPLGSEVADIGSNDDEFWFWVKESKEKAVYYCPYEEDGSSPLAAGFQPDWIVEALGLKVFSEDDLGAIKVQPGRDPGTLLLTHRSKPARGEAVVKEAVLSEATKQIKEYRVYSVDKKNLLARAVITRYEEYPSAPGPGGAVGKVYLPALFTLEWPQEKMSLDVGLRDVLVNTSFPQARREIIFTEPKMAGIPRKALAESAEVAGEPGTTIRESLPAPPPRARLGEPKPIGVGGARRTPTDPAEIGADLPPSGARGVEEVIGPPIPTVNEPLPQAVQARTGWRGSLNTAPVER